MRNLKIKMNFILLLMIIFTLLLAGCSFINHYTNDQYEEAEKMAIRYLHNNFQNITAVEIETVKDSPIGGIDVSGSVNEVKFTVVINVSSDDSLSVGGMAAGESFAELKDECKDAVCDD